MESSEKSIYYNIEKRELRVVESKKTVIYRGEKALEKLKTMITETNNQKNKVMENKFALLEAIELLKSVEVIMRKNQKEGFVMMNVVQGEIEISVGVDDKVTAAELQTISPKVKVINF